MTQVIAVANSLDPDQTRQKVFPLILKLFMSSGSNDGKDGSFKIWLVFFYGDNETLIKWTTCQPKQNENHQRTKDKRYPMQKPVFGITGQVRFKPASLATETSYSIEIGYPAIYRQWTTKMLIRLRRCMKLLKKIFFQKCPNIIRKTWLHPMVICAKISNWPIRFG